MQDLVAMGVLVGEEASVLAFATGMSFLWRLLRITSVADGDTGWPPAVWAHTRLSP